MANFIRYNNLMQRRKPKVYRKRIRFIDTMDDAEIRSRFRFNKDTIMYLKDLFGDDLQHFSKRSMAIDPEMQILLALRFYASGNFMEVIGDTMGVNKSTVSRSITRVTDALLRKKDDFIQWPDDRKKAETKEKFYSQYGFPAVVGCIDGTHIPIQAPSEDEPAFVNRKGWHSINIKAVCDCEGKFINIDARWPGSTHDAHIFRASDLSVHLETHHKQLEDGILLGDSGYGCRPFLLTPYLHPSSRMQERYNSSHSRARCTIERVFGWWKRRFHCLHGGLRLKPRKACKIIGACSILHNIAVSRRDIYDGDEYDDRQLQDVPQPPNGQGEGRAVGDFITNHYFNTA